MKKRNLAQHNSGFTLIELLVVMAISVILMYLVMQPVIESFRMTRGAQAMVEAQDSARTAMEQISREVGEAMDVLDYGTISQFGPENLELPVRNVVDTTQAAYWLPMAYAKVDLAMPKMTAHCNNTELNSDGTPQHPDSAPRDFVPEEDELAPSCPVCQQRDVTMRPKLPLEQSGIVVRYFLGLRYNNPNPAATDIPANFGWESPWGKGIEADAGNQVVLYRIEFDPNDASVFGADKVAAANKLMQVLRDPRFFYSTDACPATSGPYQGKQLWQVWADKARIVGMDKYMDLVSGNLNPDTGLFASITPSVSFKYAKVDKDPFVGDNYADAGSDTPDSMPTVFRAKFGYWTPNTYDGVTGQNGIQVYRYLSGTEIYSYRTEGGGSNNLVVRAYRNNVADNTIPDFDISKYMANRRINLSDINSATQMGYFFDFSDTALNFNAGTVNFALAVEPFIATPNVLKAINDAFNAGLENDRGSAVRLCTLPACQVLPYATIVPGSDVVTGPNMVRGADYGQPVRYKRVPLNLGDPQFNQYKINYSTGNIYFSRIEDQKLPDSDDSVTPCDMRVDYKIQFNRSGDVVQGDYQTKAMLNLHIGIRMYDPEDKADPPKPRVVELNNTVKVRNAYR